VSAYAGSKGEKMLVEGFERPLPFAAWMALFGCCRGMQKAEAER
jgi:hypothetical protein